MVAYYLLAGAKQDHYINPQNEVTHWICIPRLQFWQSFIEHLFTDLSPIELICILLLNWWRPGIGERVEPARQTIFISN